MTWFALVKVIGAVFETHNQFLKEVRKGKDVKLKNRRIVAEI